MRYAIYFCPAPASALGALGRDWLGAATPDGIPGVSPQRWSELLADVRRYGWHATMRSPFTLSPDADYDDLRRTVALVAQSFSPSTITLRLSRLGGFLALRPVGDCSAVNAMAAACTEAIETLRAPLVEPEFQHRVRGLDAIETHYLQRYGYPYVFERYRFHMTLSAPATVEEEHARQRWLALRAAAIPVARVDALSICVERSPGAAFDVLERISLRKASAA
jgi:hypothetical protein